MKKGKVLVYIITNKIYLYHTKTKREVIKETDTSLFFKCGEIKDVKGCATNLNHIISTNNLLSGIIKEDVDVLYNNVSNCDIISLYKEALDFFDCKSITFTTIEDIISELKNNTKIVYYDGETYTSFSLKKKGNNIDEFPSDSILVGRDSEGKHYSRKDIVWELYKSRFTK